MLKKQGGGGAFVFVPMKSGCHQRTGRIQAAPPFGD